MADASFETTDYHYKIYRQWLNASKIAPMVSPPWFKCLKGPVKLSDTISGNFYADSDSFQIVKIASVTISKSIDGHICRDDKILPRQSYLTATFEGATSGSLDVTKARSIRAESDCAALGIAEVSECAAYYIFNRLLKIKSFKTGNIHEY